MSEWNDMVKKHAKANPGKSLKEILPLAKQEYRKTHKVGEHKKKGKRGVHKKKGKHSVHKKKHQRGGSSCSASSSGATMEGGNVGTSSDTSHTSETDNTDNVANSGGPVAYNSDDSFYLDHQFGGRRRHKKRGSKRKGKGKGKGKSRRRRSKFSMKKYR